MTREDADFIGAMNMCDEISDEAYKKIMCHCEEQEPCEDAISRDELLKNQTVIIDDDGLAHKVVHIGRICAAPSVVPTREK